MNPELLTQLAREHLRDQERGRARASVMVKRKRTRAPLRPVGVLLLRIGLWMVGSGNAGNIPISMTSAR